MKTKPILKWAGGKTTLLHEIGKKFDLIQNKKVTFYDVFGGGASVSLFASDYFDKVVFNDTNEELVNLYYVVQRDLKQLLDIVDRHVNNHSKEYYYKIRGMDRLKNYSKISNIEKAARFLYLNKTCYNGLYRVNSNGYFNVPIGRQKRISVYDKKTIFNFSDKFKNIKILNEDYNVAIVNAKKGDVVYFDPPYDQIRQDSFIGYNGKTFDKFDQKRLANDVDLLTEKGVYVIFSNAATPRIEKLYKRYIDPSSYVNVRRMISSTTQGRAITQEILADNFKEVDHDLTTIF